MKWNKLYYSQYMLPMIFCIFGFFFPFSFSFPLCRDSLLSLGVVRLMYIICVLFVQLSEEGPCEELGGEGQISSFNEWILPAKEFDGMWERFAITNLFIVFYFIYTPASF